MRFFLYGLYGVPSGAAQQETLHDFKLLEAAAWEGCWRCRMKLVMLVLRVVVGAAVLRAVRCAV